MSIGRNDSCPCGSGKKYKNCCLKSENKKQVILQQRERFYESKQDLVEKVGDYLVQQVPIKQYNALKNTFHERTEKRIDKDIEESYFTFWLYFFYRFDNGLRGIEWFYEDNKGKLTPEELSMTKNWMDMRIRFLKAVDETEETAIFKDVLTGENFPVSNDEENLIYFYPWICTMAFLEPFNGLYYFNGLRYNVSPYNLENALETLETLKKEENLSTEEVIEAHFPELIASLLEPISVHKGISEVAEYSLTYSLNNPVIVSEFLRSQEDIKVEAWEVEKQEFTWAGNWRVYTDNACPGNVQLADAYGTLFLQENTLIFVGIEAKYQQAMKHRLESLGDVLTLEKEEKKVIGDSMARPNSVLVVLDEMVPEHFAFYAQNDLLKEVDEPIPMYDNLSLRELVSQGRESDALKWLENLEYNVFRQVQQQFEEAEVTADFNTLRREVSLPLSPFVTGGSHRKSMYEPVEVASNTNQIFEADIPFLEAIGFKPHTANHFYTADLLRYYKERTSTQTEEEAIQTTAALYDFRALLETSNIDDWQAEAVSFWKAMLISEYKELPEFTAEKHKTFLYEVDAFFAWMENIGRANFAEVRNVIQQIKE